MRFIRCEDGSYVFIPNITRLSVSVEYDNKSRILAHHTGLGMPYVVAVFESEHLAQIHLLDLVERIESGLPAAVTA